MNRSSLIKWVGTLAAAVAGGGAVFLPVEYRPLATALAGLILGALHIPQPKAAS